MTRPTSRKPAVAAVEPQLERALRLALGAGLLLVVLLPAARGHSEWLGWLPMWLVAMPATALWALHRFRLPLRPLPFRAGRVASSRRRRPGTQARRRALPAVGRLARAA
ncbi:MAG: hypothetical protein EOP02_20260 [Proteobacteria bacterium]|nr:MAG: hypothetical protein EOP02_20260 [Pseudomonadota bacterium]